MSRTGNHVIDLMERGEWPAGPDADGPDIEDENYRLSNPSAAHAYIRILQRRWPVGFNVFRSAEQWAEIGRARQICLLSDLRVLVGK